MHTTVTPDVLRQLPPLAPHFVNRDEALEDLSRLVTQAHSEDRNAFIVIMGLGGVGKSALATRFLYDCVEDQDGQLFFDLRGFSPDESADPHDVLDAFLRALGVHAETIPADLASRAAWFRSLTAGRRLGILLDNAISAAQVRSLLPGSGEHTVLVTSRSRLAGLAVDGARVLPLDPLATPDAAELLTRLVDHRSVNQDQAHGVAELCAGLPIAVTAIAVQAATGLPLPHVRHHLSQRHHRLATLGSEDQEISVQAAFDVSYDTLTPALRQTYRRLGWHLGTDITPLGAHALTGHDTTDCDRELRALVSASLLTETAPGRYRFHDLVALHARAKANDTETEEERHAAVRRLLHTYADHARTADQTLRPYAWPLGDAPSELFEDADAALQWLEDERTNLVLLAEHAAEAGLSAAAADIAEGLWSLYLRKRHATAWLRAGAAALRVVTDYAVRAHLLNNHGLVFSFLGHHQRAQQVLEEAGQIWQDRHDDARLAQTRQRQGLLALNTDRIDEAIGHFHAALDLDAHTNQPHNKAITLFSLGRAYNHQARFTDAETVLRHALTALESFADDTNRARIHTALGRAVMLTDPQQADDYLARALQVLTQRRHLVGLAETHEARGDLAHQRGQLEAARQAYQDARDLFDQLGAQHARDRVHRRLAHLET